MSDDTQLLTDPLFWALVSMAVAPAGDAIVSNVLPRSRLLGTLVVGTFMLGRTVLVLPFCSQPRFELAGFHWLVGGLTMAIALAVLVLSMRVGWTTGPKSDEELQTRGTFGLVRHPGYLGNLLLGLGWSVMFRSVIGVALTVVWWLVMVLHALIEEAALERTYGSAYTEYKARVPGRIIPGLPV